jgi:alpha-maltose-1-phosphate synthase
MLLRRPKVRPTDPLKILLVAEHASATFGGEALIPFRYFKHLRGMDVDVHLLVHERTRQELLEAFPQDDQRLHFVADSLVNIWCNKIGRLMPDRLAGCTINAVSHFETQVRQRRRARSLVRAHDFNIVHEPIPVSPKLPSMLFGVRAPVIIGPMNGGMDYPPNYNLAGRLERFIVFSLRCTAAFWNTILPGKRRAALLLVANQRTYEALPLGLRERQVLEFVENGVDVDLFKPRPAKVNQQNFRVIFVGRLVDWKRVDLLIAACARLVASVNFELDIVGDGPKRSQLEQLVQRLSLGPRVRFHGRLPQSAAAELLRNADVMVLPSMRECGGAVVLEAMASAVPVIAANWGGPADYITSETGILIPPETPERFIQGLAKAMSWMARDHAARTRMGLAARQRAEALYDWRAKAKSLVKIYEDVLRTNSLQKTMAR